ncbi:PLDc N-terminal domain-containing protein [Sphingobacterium siyangense]|uniref:PLDc N-terminal domain-containing protein n=1 Tax=Sphingobacterium siyangense TaxID=459529 RepID=UPI00374817A5
MNLLFLNIGTKEMLFLSVIPLIFVFYSIYHVIGNDNLQWRKKIFWIIGILIFNFLGCIFYWLLGRNIAKT